MAAEKAEKEEADRLAAEKAAEEARLAAEKAAERLALLEENLELPIGEQDDVDYLDELEFEVERDEELSRLRRGPMRLNIR